MKKLISFLLTFILAIALSGCIDPEYELEIEGPDSVVIGETIVLELITDYENPVVEWSSEDDSIATVDQEGYVTGVEVGTVAITATVEDVGSVNHDISVVEPDIIEYTPNQLKDLLVATKQSYSESEHGHVKIETDTGSDDIIAELIYNFNGDQIDSLMYKLSGYEEAHVYVKEGYAYMSINEQKSKSEMTATEENLIIQSYGFDTFVETTTEFYDEVFFFEALSFVETVDNTLAYELDFSAYSGNVFNLAGKDEIKLNVTFDGDSIISVEVAIYVQNDTEEESEVSKVTIYFLGTDEKAIEYPSDLDTYIE